MTPTRKLLNIRGYDVRVHIFNQVVKTLTEEIDDVVYDVIDDFLKHQHSIAQLVEGEMALVEILRYFLQDTCLEDVCHGYSVLGDERNNPPESAGSTFNIDVTFTAKHSLAPTRIRYSISYV